MPKIKVIGQTVQTGVHTQADKWTDKCYHISNLPYSRGVHAGSRGVGQLLGTSNKVAYVFIPRPIGPKAPQKVFNSNFG